MWLGGARSKLIDALVAVVLISFLSLFGFMQWMCFKSRSYDHVAMQGETSQQAAFSNVATPAHLLDAMYWANGAATFVGTRDMSTRRGCWRLAGDLGAGKPGISGGPHQVI